MDKLLELWVKAQNHKAEIDERGAAGVEYGLLVALIAAVIILTVTTLGTKVNTAFDTVQKNLK